VEHTHGDALGVLGGEHSAVASLASLRHFLVCCEEGTAERQGVRKRRKEAGSKVKWKEERGCDGIRGCCSVSFFFQCGVCVMGRE
jgi:hypothetical protein